MATIKIDKRAPAKSPERWSKDSAELRFVQSALESVGS